jgi:hypothetical protein
MNWWIEKRGDTDVVVWRDGSCRPATGPESELWRRVGRLAATFKGEATKHETLAQWYRDNDGGPIVVVQQVGAASGLRHAALLVERAMGGADG